MKEPLLVRALIVSQNAAVHICLASVAHSGDLYKKINAQTNVRTFFRPPLCSSWIVLCPERVPLKICQLIQLFPMILNLFFVIAELFFVSRCRYVGFS